MPKYKFEDIAFNITQKRKPTLDDMKTYIGLEHLDSRSLSVTRWGSNVPIKGDKLLMQKGDVLFGKRNAYLRRAAIAPHDGLFSAHGMILRPNEKVISRKLFPFFICSDYFFDAAIRISVGSLSPTINWSALKELEFILPDMNEQEKLADLLWAANNTKEAYKKLLYLTEELVKSQFVEMFGDPVVNSMGWTKDKIGNLADVIIAGQSLNGENRLVEKGEKAVLKVSAVTYGYFKPDEYKVIQDIGAIKKCIYPEEGDLLFSRANTREMVGATALITQDFPDLLLPDKLWKMSFTKRVTPVYMKFALSCETMRTQLSAMATGTSGSMFNISMEKVKNIAIPIPPTQIQERFTDFIKQTDKSKFELKQNINNLEITIKALMSKNFG